jgi:FKBP-type peptidyl-prolyl cis-trans isomerase
MATSKAQRIGIWIIAGFMAIGTIGSFAIIVLANSNGQQDQARFDQLSSEYQKANTERQAKVDAQAEELSKQYYETFNQFASRPSTFDKTSVTELKTEDLIVGTGDTIEAGETFTAYYIGWTPDGNVFDGSIDGDSLKAPYTVEGGTGVIEGWTKGVIGMKVGGARELTIPFAQAYGEQGNGTTIPASSPLKFVVMLVPTPETIPTVEVSKELTDLYARLYGN